jgi:hypothetical protein
MDKETKTAKNRTGRAERLRAALRENLRRRKAQARARAAGRDGPQHDSAEVVNDKHKD